MYARLFFILELKDLRGERLSRALASEDNFKMYRFMNTETKHGFSSTILDAKPSHGTVGGDFDEPRRKSRFIKIPQT